MPNNSKQFSGSWAIILGGSSGIGLASVEKLARHGMNIAVLYREAASAERLVKEKFSSLAANYGVDISPFNLNALDESARTAFIEQFCAGGSKAHAVKLMLHSIA